MGVLVDMGRVYVVTLAVLAGIAVIVWVALQPLTG